MSIGDLSSYVLALTPARIVILPALGGAGATLAVAVRDGRRRTVLNECLHELRRPLQALALLTRGGVGGAGEGSIEMAAAALARLEREINGAGEATLGPRRPFAARPLLETTARRWRAQATMRGKRFVLRWDADEAVLEGDRIALAAALDNLVANAIEHGGERIELAADLAGERLCLAVVDSGAGAERRARDRDATTRGRERKRRRALGRPFGRLLRRPDRRAKSLPVHLRFSGRARRGHGLRLVRRTATAHGGAFALHRGERGTSAVLELPLAPPPAPAWPPDRGAAPRRPEIVVRREDR